MTDKILIARALLQQVREWIAERPEGRTVSAGKMVAMLTEYDSAFRDHSTVIACTGNLWFGWVPLYTAPQSAAEPVAVAISYDGVSPYKLSEYGDGPLLDLEIKRLGGTARKMYLYTHPQPQPAQREWIGLTDDDLRELFTQDRAFDRLEKFSRIIEAKLREKNGSKP